MKFELLKAIGNTMLTFQEVEGILLDAECFMMNRPLVYIGEEFDRPVIDQKYLFAGDY